MTKMTVRDIFKFIYWVVMPIFIGAILFYYLNKFSNGKDAIEIWTIFIALAIPIAIIRAWVGTKIFKEDKEKPTLADKIMKCELRIKNGYDYCVKCPDNYTCASSIDKK